ncbi:hypothetical protein [Marixanthomonas ophiurae]|uniref:Uncharacterized protein n=1 Tax=Marixanthomonas ophiurae TaxID=387659 RepID=A0A3E1QBY2_9FLAO|nr:hypothetical protein [Marixanthomonas ophiurae]RFN59616.1 hypothetical protein DZ858_06030 [Marixanthomonas ophiurae]
MKTKFFVLILFLLIVVFPVDAQCAMCRAVLENEDGGSAAKGINNGIVYLMIFPYLLIGGIGYAIYKMRKNAKKAQN